MADYGGFYKSNLINKTITNQVIKALERPKTGLSTKCFPETLTDRNNRLYTLNCQMLTNRKPIAIIK